MSFCLCHNNHCNDFYSSWHIEEKSPFVCVLPTTEMISLPTISIIKCQLIHKSCLGCLCVCWDRNTAHIGKIWSKQSGEASVRITVPLCCALSVVLVILIVVNGKLTNMKGDHKRKQMLITTFSCFIVFSVTYWRLCMLDSSESPVKD